jgi:hypothetical protein
MAASSDELVVVVGTTNPTKLNSVKEALVKVFPQYSTIKVLGAAVRTFIYFIFYFFSNFLWILCLKFTHIYSHDVSYGS